MFFSLGADPAALGGAAGLEGGRSAAAIAAGAASAGCFIQSSSFGGGGFHPLDAEADVARLYHACYDNDLV